ncbi:cyclase family protein [Nonomuraea muscovyensis]|uniref:cyclase family protein n=1 Tax=Nonomuraea muscovyensis TaxID=1124761 RepID=UPI003408EF71
MSDAPPAPDRPQDPAASDPTGDDGAGDRVDHRASFDATITFGNGGDLTVHGFRVDLPSPRCGEDEIAALFVASLGLLMTDEVRLSDVRVFPEPHKGTRGGPSDRSAPPPGRGGPLVELDHASPAAATSIETPADLAALRLSRVADLPAVVVRVVGAGPLPVGVGALAAFDVRGAAVLLHTGARHGHPLTPEAATWLVERGAALVGTDAAALDDTFDGAFDGAPAGAGTGPATPARRILLDAGIPLIEGLAGLDGLPPTGALLTAVPPRLAGTRRAPVRAFARLPAR